MVTTGTHYLAFYLAFWMNSETHWQICLATTRPRRMRLTNWLSSATSPWERLLLAYPALGYCGCRSQTRTGPLLCSFSDNLINYNKPISNKASVCYRLFGRHFMLLARRTMPTPSAQLQWRVILRKNKITIPLIGIHFDLSQLRLVQLDAANSNKNFG